MNMTIAIANTSFQVAKTLKHCDLLFSMLSLHIASITLKCTHNNDAFNGFVHKGVHLSCHFVFTSYIVHSVS